MSIPLDRLYHYIEQTAQQIRCGDVIIYRFLPHGSKKIEDLCAMPGPPWPKWPMLPQLFCYDQEPLNYELYENLEYQIPNRHQDWGIDTPRQNIRTYPADNIYDQCILLHSEQRSAEVKRYHNNGFIPVYYWNHAFLALDWLRYAQHVTPKKIPKQKFLIYNRAWTGTREYRLKFVDLLTQHNLTPHCQMFFNPVDNNIHYTKHKFANLNFVPSNNNFESILKLNNSDSSASADFELDDYNNTEVEVVLETLFDDQRIQLTEKILRPIACGHPFILVSTPGSLEYLRDYGFRTFENVWDENYDTIQDPVERLNEIVKLMKYLSTQPNLSKQVQAIVDHNKKHFFSTDFFNLVLQELQQNLASAFDELESTHTSNTFINTRKSLVENETARFFSTGANDPIARQGIVQVIKEARKHYYNRS